MKITTPHEMKTPLMWDLEILLYKFEEKFKEEAKGLSKYYLAVLGQAAPQLLVDIKYLYEAVGWMAACYNTNNYVMLLLARP